MPACDALKQQGILNPLPDEKVNYWTFRHDDVEAQL